MKKLHIILLTTVLALLLTACIKGTVDTTNILDITAITETNAAAETTAAAQKKTEPEETTESPTETTVVPTAVTEVATEVTTVPTEATHAATQATEAPTEVTTAPTETEATQAATAATEPTPATTTPAETICEHEVVTEIETVSGGTVHTHSCSKCGEVFGGVFYYGEKKECEGEHELELVDYTIDESYTLYNYVTESFECVNCDYTCSKSHADGKEVSAATIASEKAQIVSLVNQMRAENGLSQLLTTSEWDAWAGTRAKELASFYGHARPDGSSWAYAIGNCYTVAENIAAGQESGADFYFAFYNSAPHRGNMMVEEAVGIAVGLYTTEDGRTYCAMVLICEYE